MSIWFKMYLRGGLFMLGLALVFAGQFGLDFEEFKFYLVFPTLGLVLTVISVVWWYRDFKGK